MHSQTKIIFVDFQRLTLITILWLEETAPILCSPKDKNYWSLHSSGIWHCANGWSVAKISRILYCLKIWDTDHPMKGHLHPYKSPKTQIKLFLITHHWNRSEVRSGNKRELSAGHSSQELIQRIRYVTRRYKAWQCRQNYLRKSSFSTLLWTASPTNGITTQRLKNLYTWRWRQSCSLTSHLHADLLACMCMWIFRQQTMFKQYPPIMLLENSHTATEPHHRWINWHFLLIHSSVQILTSLSLNCVRWHNQTSKNADAWQLQILKTECLLHQCPKRGCHGMPQWMLTFCAVKLQYSKEQ
jgi:hypothetical protein